MTAPTWSHSKGELRGPPPAEATLTHRPGTPAEPTHQCPEHIDSEEGDGEGNEPHSLQPAVQTEVVLGPSKAQPA